MLSRVLDVITEKSAIMSLEEMYQWINENQILSIIFDPRDYNIQTIKYSGHILNFFLNHGYLDEQQIDVFWIATKISMEVKQEMLRIF